MLPSLADTLPLLIHYGYFFLFLIAVIEGPIITILGSFLAAQGDFNVIFVFLVVVLGDLAGDVLYYGIGRVGVRARWLLRLVGLSDARLLELKTYFETKGARAMFFAKYTQTGFLALPAAGAAGMPFGKFLWYNTLGTIPKSFVFVLIGYFFGYAYAQINAGLEKFSFVLAVFGIALLVYFFVRSKYAKKSPSNVV